MPPPASPTVLAAVVRLAAVAPGASQLPKEFVDFVAALLAISGVIVALLCISAVCRRVPSRAQRSAATPKLQAVRRRKARTYARLAPNEEELDDEIGMRADNNGELALKDTDGVAYTREEYLEFYGSKRGAKRWAAAATAADAAVAHEAAQQAFAREARSKKKRPQQCRKTNV